MAATVTVMSAFLEKGDHCVLTDTCYGGTNRVTRMQFGKYGIEFSYVDMRDPKKVEEAIIPGRTKLVFSESPANPPLTLVDIEAVSQICGEKNVLHCCDSTFA